MKIIFYPCVYWLPQLFLLFSLEFQLSLTYYKRTRRHSDADNMLASTKNGLDGMCIALGIDDRQFKEIIIKRADDIGGYVVVELMNVD